MSELKVNTIQPIGGSIVTIAAQVEGQRATSANQFVTKAQLDAATGVGGGVDVATVQEIANAAKQEAKRYSDDQDTIQTETLIGTITVAKSEAIGESKQYTDDAIAGIGGAQAAFSNIEMPNWNYYTTWTDDQGRTGPREEYNKFNTTRFDGTGTSKVQIAGINGISVTGATGYEFMTTGTGSTETVPYQRIIIDGDKHSFYAYDTNLNGSTLSGIVYNHTNTLDGIVLSNPAYRSSSGIMGYHAPIDGVYRFYANCFMFFTNGAAGAFYFIKNSTKIGPYFRGSDTANDGDSVSGTITLGLSAGDKITIALSLPNNGITQVREMSFSGGLV